MWKINICKIPCLNTSGILPGNTTFSYHKNKNYDHLWEKTHTGMHNTFLVIVNEKVNQSRGATCYSSGFSYHLCQLTHLEY